MKNYQLAALALCIHLAACTSTDTAPEQEPASEPEISFEQPVADEVPSRPFPDDSFHELLVAEFAVRRNRYDLALGNYLQQAHRTRDAGVTSRATRLAQFLRADKATLDAAQLWVELEPDNLEAQYTLATMLAKNGRIMAALDHMTIVLEGGGHTNFPAVIASALNLDIGLRQQSEERIDQLLAKHKDNTQLMTSKALLLQQREQPEQALAMIRQVLAFDEKDLHAVVVEARLLQQLERNEEAFTRLEKVVQQHPNNRRLRLQYARMLMNKDINLAREQFEVLLSQTPTDADLLLSLGIISQETDLLDDAEVYFKRLLETGKRTSQAHYYLGQVAEKREQWQQAIQHYQNVPLGSDFISAINRITQLYQREGMIETARSYLQNLRLQHPQHSIRLYLFEANLLLSSKQYEQGQQLLTEALLIHPKQANLLWTRSMFSEKLDNIELMTSDLEEVIAQDPDNAVALNALGYTLADRAIRLDEAYVMIKRALELKPKDPAILDSLGWVQYRRGNMLEAISLLQQAFEAFPDHEVAAHYGEILWIMGQKEQAMEVWTKGLLNNPNSPIINETMQRLNVMPTEQPAPAAESDQ